MIDKYFFEILVGLIFIISLLGTLIFFLAKKIQKESDFLKEKTKKAHEKEKFILESLDIICKALIQEQCEISEGSLRIRRLIENSKMIDTKKVEFEIFFEMDDELKIFKTHDERNSLTKQERINEDILRFKIEEKYQDQFLKAVRLLHVEVKDLL